MKFQALHPSRLVPLFVAGSAAMAHAHPGHYHPPDEVDEFDTLPAVLHPFTGLDHLLAALAVGWIAWTVGRRLGTMIVAGFLLSMIAGITLGRFSLSGGYIEQGLALSVAGLGVLLALSRSCPAPLRVALVVSFGLCHGLAHGTELPAGISAPAWGMAMVTGTSLICAAGTVLGTLSSQLGPVMPRLAGAALTVTGVTLLLLI